MKIEIKKNILSGLMMIGIVGLLMGCSSAENNNNKQLSTQEEAALKQLNNLSFKID